MAGLYAGAVSAVVASVVVGHGDADLEGLLQIFQTGTPLLFSLYPFLTIATLKVLVRASGW